MFLLKTFETKIFSYLIDRLTLVHSGTLSIICETGPKPSSLFKSKLYRKGEPTNHFYNKIHIKTKHKRI